MPPTILKKKHTLKGVNLLPLAVRCKNIDLSTVRDYARMQSSQKTEEMSMDDMLTAMRSLLDESVSIEELFELSRREMTPSTARLMLHCMILYANEFGQPKGQDLRPIRTIAADVTSNSSPQVATVTREDEASHAKRLKLDSDQEAALEKRVLSLEQINTDPVTTLKQKVRSLALQQEPCEPLILLTLDELSRTARKVGSEDSDTYEELARQANRHRGKLDMASLCLSVLGGKAADTITKALNKCMKEKQIESKLSVDNLKTETVDSQVKSNRSPLANLYPNMPMLYPSAFPYPTSYPSMMYPMSNYQQQGFRQRGTGIRFQRPRGACLFCSSLEHHVRDCEKMKNAKPK